MPEMRCFWFGVFRLEFVWFLAFGSWNLGVPMPQQDEHKSLEKWIPTLASKEELYDALEKAFDYRGDITINMKDGSKFVGYVFNREPKAAEPFIEAYPAD